MMRKSCLPSVLKGKCFYSSQLALPPSLPRSSYLTVHVVPQVFQVLLELYTLVLLGRQLRLQPRHHRAQRRQPQQQEVHLE